MDFVINRNLKFQFITAEKEVIAEVFSLRLAVVPQKALEPDLFYKLFFVLIPNFDQLIGKRF